MDSREEREGQRVLKPCKEVKINPSKVYKCSEVTDRTPEDINIWGDQRAGGKCFKVMERK